MPTKQKKQTVKEFQELFTSSQALIFTDYRGLSVADITNLRRQLRDKGVEYHVAKNTLTTLAAEKAGMSDMVTLLDGPTAIAFVGDDIPGAAKVLTDFVRTSKILQIRGGMMGHSMLNPSQVDDLTKILTREQYIAKLLGSMQSPISNLTNVMAGIIRSFVNVTQARVDQLKEQEGETEAAPVAQVEAQVEAPAEATAPIAQAEAAPQASEEVQTEAPVEAPTEDAPAEAQAEASEEAPTEEAPAEAPDEESAS